MCNCCDHPIYRNWENFCRNCGADKKYSQFTKKSEWEYTGSVSVRPRWYVIIITSKNDEDSYYEFTQKETKALEQKTELKGQELADLIASKTEKISYHYNGKYGKGHISYDLRSEEQKEADRIKREKINREYEETRAEREAEAQRKRIEIEKKRIEEWNSYAWQLIPITKYKFSIDIETEWLPLNIYNAIKNIGYNALAWRIWKFNVILPSTEEKAKSLISSLYREEAKKYIISRENEEE